MTNTTLSPVAARPVTRSPRSDVPTAPRPEALAVLAARTAVALEASLTRFHAAAAQNLGYLETQVAHDVQELLRTTTQRAAQAKAAATPSQCPVCGQPLTRCAAGHARTFQTRFGDIPIQRTRGYCKRCRKWRTPADTASAGLPTKWTGLNRRRDAKAPPTPEAHQVAPAREGSTQNTPRDRLISRSREALVTHTALQQQRQTNSAGTERLYLPR